MRLDKLFTLLNRNMVEEGLWTEMFSLIFHARFCSTTVKYSTSCPILLPVQLSLRESTRNLAFSQFTHAIYSLSI